MVDTHVPIDVIGDAKGSSHKKTPWNPSEFELWVEHGVVWDLKQIMIMGFIDYASIAPYFKSTLAFRANTGMFKGSPFSLSDFPVYGYMGPPYIGWIFSALHMLTYLPTAWSLEKRLAALVVRPGPRTGGGGSVDKRPAGRRGRSRPRARSTGAWRMF